MARAGRRATLSPGVCSGELAGLARFRHRRARRHGLPHHRSSRLGIPPGPAQSVQARTTIEGSFLDGDKPNFETYPIASIITYEFPARGELPPVRMTWYEGGLMPPDPSEMGSDQHLPDNGVLYVGSKGKMFMVPTAGCPSSCPACSMTRPPPSPRPCPARPGITRSGCRLQGRPAAGLELRLRRPDDGDRPAGRAGAAGAGATAGMGQRRT